MILKLKPVYLSRIMNYIFLGGGAVVILFMLFFPLHWAYKYFVSMVFLFVALLYGFYLNRNDLLIIQCNPDNVEFSFINNVFFKRKTMKLQRVEIEYNETNGVMSFLRHGKLFAILRKKSVNDIEWEQLTAYFKTTRT